MRAKNIGLTALLLAPLVVLVILVLLIVQMLQAKAAEGSRPPARAPANPAGAPDG